MARYSCRMMFVGVGIYAARKLVSILFSTSIETCGDCDIVRQAIHIVSLLFLSWLDSYLPSWEVTVLETCSDGH
jgi:hypothetical protein